MYILQETEKQTASVNSITVCSCICTNLLLQSCSHYTCMFQSSNALAFYCRISGIIIYGTFLIPDVATYHLCIYIRKAWEVCDQCGLPSTNITFYRYTERFDYSLLSRFNMWLHENWKYVAPTAEEKEISGRDTIVLVNPTIHIIFMLIITDISKLKNRS
jgi:hypothetical protein